MMNVRVSWGCPDGAEVHRSATGGGAATATSGKVPMSRSPTRTACYPAQTPNTHERRTRLPVRPAAPVQRRPGRPNGAGTGRRIATPGPTGEPPAVWSDACSGSRRSARAVIPAGVAARCAFVHTRHRGLPGGVDQLESDAAHRGSSLS
jgi:hypothetical protein